MGCQHRRRLSAAPLCEVCSNSHLVQTWAVACCQRHHSQHTQLLFAPAPRVGPSRRTPTHCRCDPAQRACHHHEYSVVTHSQRHQLSEGGVCGSGNEWGKRGGEEWSKRALFVPPTAKSDRQDTRLVSNSRPIIPHAFISHRCVFCVEQASDALVSSAHTPRPALSNRRQAAAAFFRLQSLSTQNQAAAHQPYLCSTSHNHGAQRPLEGELEQDRARAGPGEQTDTLIACCRRAALREGATWDRANRLQLSNRMHYT